MMIKVVRFNIYLFLAVAVLSGTGCASHRKRNKELTTIELHLEVNPDGGSDNITVPIYRAHPIYVNVDQDFFLDGVDLVETKVVNDLGGFELQLHFNWRGTQLLESITAANSGKHIAVICRFPGPRWLAAPVIRKQISDGVFSFTPDCTREEADHIAKGLNNITAQIKKKDKL
jgi:preprotein translocase subunit SecD